VSAGAAAGKNLMAVLMAVPVQCSSADGSADGSAMAVLKQPPIGRLAQTGLRSLESR
jgi:hypothetical protein